MTIKPISWYSGLSDVCQVTLQENDGRFGPRDSSKIDDILSLLEHFELIVGFVVDDSFGITMSDATPTAPVDSATIVDANSILFASHIAEYGVRWLLSIFFSNRNS